MKMETRISAFRFQSEFLEAVDNFLQYLCISDGFEHFGGTLGTLWEMGLPAVPVSSER